MKNKSGGRRKSIVVFSVFGFTVSESGWMLLLMTNYQPDMANFSMSHLEWAMSSGALFWKRLMLSKYVSTVNMLNVISRGNNSIVLFS